MTGTGSTRQAAGTDECSRLRVVATTALAAVLALAFLAAEAAAQYTVLGGAPASVPDEESLRKNVEEARWSAGPFRFQPWIGLRDVSYVRSQQNLSGDDVEDQLTVTVGAGIRAYAPAGPKMIWAAHVLPEFVWWQNDNSKARLNGRYGVGVFGFGSRLQFQVSHRLAEEQNFFSDEVQELTTTSSTTSQAGVEVKIVRGLYAFGSWSRTEFQGNDSDAAVFALLDRVESGWSGGLRLRSHRGWSVGIGIKQTEGEFDPGARDFSFDAESVTLDLGVNLGRVTLGLNLEDSDIEPQPGSQIERLQQTFGNFEVGIKAARRLGVEAYAQRTRSFSVAANRSLIVGDEQGLRFLINLTSWSVRLLAGRGGLETEGLGTAPDQTDDYDVLGASVGFSFRRLATVQLNLLQRTYDSGLLSDDRDVTSLGLSIQLGEAVRRLSVGEAGSLW